MFTNKKVVLASNTTWNIVNFRRCLIDSLMEAGFKVYAVSPTDKYVEELVKIGVIHYHVKINQKGANPIEDLKLIKRYKKIYQSIRPDIILSFTIKPNIYSSIIAYKLGVPIINNISGLGTLFIKKSINSFVSYVLYKLTIQKASHVFFQNNDDALLFLKFRLVEKSKMSVIPGSGVNVNTFNIDRTRNVGLTYLFVGRLIGDKGIREFMSASKVIAVNYPTVKFLVVGELNSPNRSAINSEEFEDFINENPQIDYLGNCDDMISVYAKADVLVLPSYREGLSKSLIEACAMSIPIITTNVTGCRDVVIDGFNGFLCEAKNVNSLVESIEYMINTTEENRLFFGRNGRSRAEKDFSEELVVKSYMSKVISLLSERPNDE